MQVTIAETLNFFHEVPGSNLGKTQGYPKPVFRGFSQFLHVNSKISTLK